MTVQKARSTDGLSVLRGSLFSTQGSLRGWTSLVGSQATPGEDFPTPEMSRFLQRKCDVRAHPSANKSFQNFDTMLFMDWTIYLTLSIWHYVKFDTRDAGVKNSDAVLPV